MYYTSKLFILSFTIFISGSHFSFAANKPKLQKIIGTDTFYYTGGKKGVLLCFHGAGGSAKGWTRGENYNYLMHFKNKGYSFICPSSKTKQWSTYDIKKVNDILNKLKIPAHKKLFVVGHSNGGGFASKYIAFSKRKFGAVHFANSTGASPIVHNSNWKTPTFYSYAQCDKVVPVQKVNQSWYKLRVKKNRKLLDFAYRLKRSRTCHEFINTSMDFLKFSEKAVQRDSR